MAGADGMNEGQRNRMDVLHSVREQSARLFPGFDVFLKMAYIAAAAERHMHCAPGGSSAQVHDDAVQSVAVAYIPFLENRRYETGAGRDSVVFSAALCQVYHSGVPCLPAFRSPAP